MDKLDFKKSNKDLYLPPENPRTILVPKMTFIMIDGKGDPNQSDGEYAAAIGTLYALTYTIKMSTKGNHMPAGYFEYIVPPLEGLWWYDDGGPFRFGGKAHFCWTSMLRQPEFVTQNVFEWACMEVTKKKPDLDISKARLNEFEEGLCVQCMHIGPFDDEPRTVKKMEDYMHEQNLLSDFSDHRRHHEIYLGDLRKIAPEKMKTVVRHPAKFAR